jgi:diguanylate cyclase (GGDEF)-like protein
MTRRGGANPADAESRRLMLVRRLGLLDTPADERFDVFTRLAASVARAPVSTVSLIDEQRVWFKSALGLPEGVTEVPRDIAACSLVAQTDEKVLVIPDAREDPRVANSPLVTGSFGMRFYAGAPLRAPTGEVLGALCIIDREPRIPDPEVIRALEELATGVSTALRIHEMSELALKDPLTGLGNRRILEEAMDGAIVDGEEAVGLLLVDLDGFRACNEILGHAGADQVLREIGQRLAMGVRETDVAARLGGDEFAVLLTRPDEPEAGESFRAIGERIAQSIRGTPVRVEGQGVRVTGSVGVAFAARRATGAAGPDARALLRAADAALYAAKRAGRDRVVLAAGGSARGIGSKNTLARDLRLALASGDTQLALAFQPIRSCGEGTPLTGFEALLRWTHPDHGAVPPAEFIPIAERYGLAAELDRFVLRLACREAMRAPRVLPPVAVNITPSFFVGPDFLPAVDEALRDSGLPPERLCIELTERVFLADRAPAVAAAAALVERGVGVALDDFGAGHASFGYLAELRATKVKLDGALVAALGGGRADPARATAIMRGIVGIAREIGLAVVAESVETAEQLAQVRALGCDEAQGWFLGEPAPLARWIAALRRDAA